MVISTIDENKEKMLENLNDIDPEIYYNLSNLVIPFSKFYKKESSPDIYTGKESIPFCEGDSSSNQINKIEGLNTLVNLESLGLGSNRIMDCMGLENLKRLRNLDLYNNPIPEDSNTLKMRFGHLLFVDIFK